MLPQPPKIQRRVPNCAICKDVRADAEKNIIFKAQKKSNRLPNPIRNLSLFPPSLYPLSRKFFLFESNVLTVILHKNKKQTKVLLHHHHLRIQVTNLETLD
jgi:hypothetical protein